jgi:hypothetical protein
MTQSEATLYCYRHPTRATTLRCNNCERPICSEDAIRTPTGYRCPECVKSHLRKFDTANWYDYLVGGAVTFALTIVVSALVVAVSAFVGFFMYFIAFGAAAAAGRLIGDVALRAVGKRRSRPLFLTCALGVSLGVIVVALISFFTAGPFSLIYLAIFGVVAVPVVYQRVSGLKLFG